jgi:hypothetical protein
MAAHRAAPSLDDTRRVLQELEHVADELQQLRERASELKQSESKPHLRHRSRRRVDDHAPAGKHKHR